MPKMPRKKMPPKRRPRKKRKQPARVKAYKNSYAIAKITAPLMPKTRLCMMNYVQRFRLDPQAINAGSGDTHNSLSDENIHIK